MKSISTISLWYITPRSCSQTPIAICYSTHAPLMHLSRKKGIIKPCTSPLPYSSRSPIEMNHQKVSNAIYPTYSHESSSSSPHYHLPPPPQNPPPQSQFSLFPSLTFHPTHTPTILLFRQTQSIPPHTPRITRRIILTKPCPPTRGWKYTIRHQSNEETPNTFPCCVDSSVFHSARCI
jgi:hypothetical protein